MNFKKLLLSAILASASVFGASSAYAAVACPITYGPVEQVYTVGNTTYVFVSPAYQLAHNAGYVIGFSTTDPNEASALQASLHKNVYIRGTTPGTSCPTTGTYRYWGVVDYVFAN